MIDREYIVAEIQRLAAENGGAPPGARRFENETDIRVHQWRRYWARWGDALREAGMEPNELQVRFTDEYLAAMLAEETRRLGHFPTDGELIVRHHDDAAFPDARVFGNRWRKAGRVEAVETYCRERPDFADVLAIIAPLRAASPDPGAATRGRLAPVLYGAVYLIKMGRRYKIGKTNAVGRRERELAIQLPEPTRTVHVIQTDDPAGIEAYWHHRFKDRRANGEWFALTPDDIAAFKRRKFM
jgi:hypothetical protein